MKDLKINDFGDFKPTALIASDSKRGLTLNVEVDLIKNSIEYVIKAGNTRLTTKSFDAALERFNELPF